MIDLDAYFRRTGYEGARTANRDVLEGLQRAHVSSIPFESLNPLLGRPVRLAPEALEEKLVRQPRGGYCFEQNGLFFHVLGGLGFRVTPLAARVRLNQPQDAPPTPLSHMLLLVHLECGDFLCDVGFGGQSPPSPLQFEPGLEQSTSHGDYRIVSILEGHQLEMRSPEMWAPLYRFRLEPQSASDYEMFNWYTATHPTSRFVNNLVASRISGGNRLTLLNRETGVRHPDGHSERTMLTTAGALHECLAREFGIGIEREAIEELWPRLPRT